MINILENIQKEAKQFGVGIVELCKMAGIQVGTFYAKKKTPERLRYHEYLALMQVLEHLKAKAE